jgi:hypothetical protein
VKKCNHCQYLVACLGTWGPHTIIINCKQCHRLFITHRPYSGLPSSKDAFYANGRFDTRPPEPCWRRQPGVYAVCSSCSRENTKLAEEERIAHEQLPKPSL